MTELVVSLAESTKSLAQGIVSPQLQIVQEIRRYENAIRELKSRYNLLTPIAILPAEILCGIFMFLPQRVPKGYSNGHKVYWHRFAATHICSLWRKIALECSRLWDRPDFWKPKWAYEMINRSKMTPLTIEFNPSGPRDIKPDILGAFLESWRHLERINEIDITIVSSVQMEQFLNGINGHPAPSLHTLHLKAGTGNTCFIPKDFLAGDAPRLVHVELSGCQLHWDSSLLRNLMVLKVCYPERGPTAPTLDQLISVLAAMPQLKVLDLANALPRSRHTSSTQKPHVDLHHLRQLRVVGTLEECAIFLEHVFTSPRAIDIQATCSQLPEHGSATLELINQVVRHTTTGTAIPLIKSLLMQLGKDCFSVDAWESDPLVEPSGYWALTGWLKVAFMWQNAIIHEHQFDDLVSVVCSSLPLSLLNNLRFEGGKVIPQTFLKVFKQMPSVSTVTIDVNNFYALVTVLDPSTAIHHQSLSNEMSSEGSESNHPLLAFPSLRTLTLQWVNFVDNGNDGNTLLSVLRDCLVRREGLECGIQKLILRYCPRTPGQVEELKKVVNVELEGPSTLILGV